MQGNPMGAAQATKMADYDPSDEPSFGAWCMHKLVNSNWFQSAAGILANRNAYLNAVDETVQTYPWTATFITSLAFAGLYLTNKELDQQRYPVPNIENPYSKLGQKIRNGRMVRKALGGRPFYKYCEDMAKFGVFVNEKKFREDWPEFVDEKEWFEFIYKQMELMQSGDDNEDALEEFMMEEQRKELEAEAQFGYDDDDEEGGDEYDDDDDDEYDDDDEEEYDDDDYE